MKYTLDKNDKVNHFGTDIYRVIYSDGVKGGYIQSEHNLSQDGNCRILENARVYGNAQVYGDALVYGNARVFGDALVYGDARVFGYARVSGNARVYGNARVSGDAQVYGNAWVSGDAQVSGDALVSGNAWVFGDARVSGNAKIEKSTDCVFISGLGYHVTVTPINAVIGGIIKTHAEWLDTSRDKAKALGLDPEIYKKIRSHLALIFKSFVVNE